MFCFVMQEDEVKDGNRKKLDNTLNPGEMAFNR